MIAEFRLDLNQHSLTIHLDFQPRVVVIINPSPYVVEFDITGISTTPYQISAGGSLTLPTKQRDYRAELVVSGTPPSSIAPVTIHFTDEDMLPAASTVGVAPVLFRNTLVFTSVSGSYSVVGTTFVAIDDSIYALPDFDSPSGKALITISGRFTKVSGTSRLRFAVYDPLSDTTQRFAELDLPAVGNSIYITLVGPVDLQKPGVRTLYLRWSVTLAGSQWDMSGTAGFFAALGV